MDDKKLEFINEYEKPVMEIIDISKDYAIVTSGCGGGSGEENEGPNAGDDY